MDKEKTSYHPAIFHSLRLPSAVPAARVWPFGLNVTDWTESSLPAGSVSAGWVGTESQAGSQRGPNPAPDVIF